MLTAWSVGHANLAKKCLTKSTVGRNVPELVATLNWVIGYPAPTFNRTGCDAAVLGHWAIQNFADRSRTFYGIGAELLSPSAAMGATHLCSILFHAKSLAADAARSLRLIAEVSEIS